MDNKESINITCNIDIKDYLSEDTMKCIAEGIFKAKINESVDKCLVTWRSNGINIINQILGKCVEEYAKKLAPEFEESFFKVCEREIYKTEKSTDEECELFSELLRFKLQKVGEEYIDEHKDEIMSLMKDKINKKAVEVSENNFIYLLQKEFENSITNSLKNLLNTMIDQTSKNLD